MIVLDCSAAMAVVLETEEGNALSSLIEQDEKVISSDLFIAEIDSAMAKHVKHGDFDNELAYTLMKQAHMLVDEYFGLRSNYVEAFDEGLRNKHSTYDMFYLTLARRNGATLFTLDKRLGALCDKLKIDCVHKVDLSDE